MKTINDNFERNRDAEHALHEQLSLNREVLLEKLLASLDIDRIGEKDFNFLLSFIKDFENNQTKVLQAYNHEKTMNDNYFNGLYE